MPGLQVLMAAAAATYGAVVGSFLNVCVHRLPRGLSVVRPRSACPGCGAAIAWYDNVPVLSWALLRARCRSCQSPISIRYPLVEATTAALFALLIIVRGPTVTWAAQSLFAAAMVALILIDAEHQILPNVITLPGIVFGLVAAPLCAAFDQAPVSPLAVLVQSIQGAAVGYAVPWAVNAAYHGVQRLRGVPGDKREDGIGQGDFKLLAMIGAFLGTRMALFCLFGAALTGAICGVYMIWFRGYGWKSKLPFGVFLGGAAILALFIGKPAIDWYAGLLTLDR